LLSLTGIRQDDEGQWALTEANYRRAVVKPEYIQLLYTDEIGSKFLTYAIISEIVGILIIRRIASPRF